MRLQFDSDRSVVLALSVVLFVALLLRIAAIGFIPHQPESDELAYLSMAQSILRGEQIVDNMGNRAMYNVGYPMFVVAPVQWLFGEGLLAVKLANALLGCLAVTACYAVARECGAGVFGGLVAAALWAVYLPASVYSTYVLKEALMVPLMLGAAWCCVRVLRRPTIVVAVVAGLCFGLLALVGNAGLALLGVGAVALVLAPTDWLGRLKLMSVGALVLALVAAPWMYRNHLVLGTPLLNTNGGFNLYLGNNPAATGMFVSIKDTPMGSAWPELLAKDEVKASETLKAEAVSWIREDPGHFIALAVRKGLLFWAPPTHEGKGQASSAEKVVRLVWLVQFVLIGGLALTGLIWRKARTPQTVLLWVAIGLYTLVHMIFYVIFRYREPIMPFLCVGAAIAIERIVHSRAGVSA